MLLISMGWTITIDDMGGRPRQFFVLAFALFLIFRTLYAFCRQPALCPAYVLSFRLIKFLITFAIIIALNQTVERLRIQTAEQQFTQNQSEVFIKLKMLK
jgi:large-conductance mechanosensitive channel